MPWIGHLDPKKTHSSSHPLPFPSPRSLVPLVPSRCWHQRPPNSLGPKAQSLELISPADDISCQSLTSLSNQAMYLPMLANDYLKTQHGIAVLLKSQLCQMQGVMVNLGPNHAGLLLSWGNDLFIDPLPKAKAPTERRTDGLSNKTTTALKPIKLAQSETTTLFCHLLPWLFQLHAALCQAICTKTFCKCNYNLRWVHVLGFGRKGRFEQVTDLENPQPPESPRNQQAKPQDKVGLCQRRWQG